MTTPTPPTLRAFLRANPGAATDHVRPDPILAVFALVIVGAWCVIVIGVVRAWHDGNLADFVAAYAFDFVIPVGFATVVVAWLAWTALVRRWLLTRVTWAMTNDTLLVTGKRGARRLIPFSAIVEIRVWARGYPVLGLDPARPDAAELAAFYETEFRVPHPDAGSERAMGYALERLGIRDGARWECTSRSYDFAHPTIYRRRAAPPALRAASSCSC